MQAGAIQTRCIPRVPFFVAAAHGLRRLAAAVCPGPGRNATIQGRRHRVPIHRTPPIPRNGGTASPPSHCSGFGGSPFRGVSGRDGARPPTECYWRGMPEGRLVVELEGRLRRRWTAWPVWSPWRGWGRTAGAGPLTEHVRSRLEGWASKAPSSWRTSNASRGGRRCSLTRQRMDCGGSVSLTPCGQACRVGG